MKKSNNNGGMIFTCDCDDCKEKFESKNGAFPYNLGWRYLNNLNWKSDIKKFNVIKEKHYCSLKHLLQDVVKEMMK